MSYEPALRPLSDRWTPPYVKRPAECQCARAFVATSMVVTRFDATTKRTVIERRKLVSTAKGWEAA